MAQSGVSPDLQIEQVSIALQYLQFDVEHVAVRLNLRGTTKVESWYFAEMVSSCSPSSKPIKFSITVTPLRVNVAPSN